MPMNLAQLLMAEQNIPAASVAQSVTPIDPTDAYPTRMQQLIQLLGDTVEGSVRDVGMGALGAVKGIPKVASGIAGGAANFLNYLNTPGPLVSFAEEAAPGPLGSLAAPGRPVEPTPITPAPPVPALGNIPEVPYENPAVPPLQYNPQPVTPAVPVEALTLEQGNGSLIPATATAVPAVPLSSLPPTPAAAPTAVSPPQLPAVDLASVQLANNLNSPVEAASSGQGASGFFSNIGRALADPNIQYMMASMGAALSPPGSPAERLGTATAGLAQNRIYADALASGQPAPFLNPEAQTAVQKLGLDRENLELNRQLLGVRSKVAQAELERALNPEPVKLQQVDLGNKIGMVDPTTGQIRAEFPVVRGPEVRLAGDGRIAIFDPANPADVQYIGEPKAETSDSIIQKGRLLSQIKSIVDPSLSSMTSLAGKPTVGADGKLNFSRVPAPEVLNQLRLQEYIKQAQQMAQTDPANAALLMELIEQFQAGLGGAEQPSGFELDEEAARELLKGF